MLKKRGKYRYGSEQADIREEIVRYSRGNYPATRFGDARCPCSSMTFRLQLDDAEGAAVRTCAACAVAHPMGDSAEFLDGATLEECACPCGAEVFEVSVGVALFADSDDVRWLYVGCRCPACGIVGVYGDWKNEFDGYADLLGRI